MATATSCLNDKYAEQDKTFDFSGPGLTPAFLPSSRTGVPSAWYGHVPFGKLLTTVCRPRLLVELGVHAGVSYSSFCDGVLTGGFETRCFGVDTWRGDLQAGFYDETVFHSVQAMNAARYADFSTLLRCTFDEALNHFEDRSIDFLHIDGYHDYESVRHDWESWQRKLSSRAVVLFHDISEYAPTFGVWRLWGELTLRFPHFAFAHSHGLGMLYTGDQAPAFVRRLCSLPNDEADTIRCRFARLGEAVCLTEQVRQASEQAAVDRLALSTIQAQFAAGHDTARQRSTLRRAYHAVTRLQAVLRHGIHNPRSRLT